jgi:serine/threonine-protein kinase
MIPGYEDFINPTPLAAAVANATLVFAGNHVTCAVDSSGAVSCWGADVAGGLGDVAQAAPFTPSPVAVTGVPPVTLVAPSYYSTCAIANGAVYCWGDDALDGEGISTDAGSSLFKGAIATGLASDVVQVASAPTFEVHHCALDSKDDVYCWGDNYYGECGHIPTSSDDQTCGAGDCVRLPTKVMGLP